MANFFIGVMPPSYLPKTAGSLYKGPVKIIACIEDPVIIEKILAHLEAKEAQSPPRKGL